MQRVLIAVTVIFLLALTQLSCGDEQGCGEKCKKTGDCAKGLTCFDTAEGMKCMPDECTSCWNRGEICVYGQRETNVGTQCLVLECR